MNFRCRPLGRNADATVQALCIPPVQTHEELIVRKDVSYITRCLSRQQLTANDGVLCVQDVINVLGAVL